MNKSILSLNIDDFNGYFYYTKYLFVDSLSSNTSKMNKTRKYNIEILTYVEALNKDF